MQRGLSVPSSEIRNCKHAAFKSVSVSSSEFKLSVNQAARVAGECLVPPNDAPLFLEGQKNRELLVFIEID